MFDNFKSTNQVFEKLKQLIQNTNQQNVWNDEYYKYFSAEDSGGNYMVTELNQLRELLDAKSFIRQDYEVQANLFDSLTSQYYEGDTYSPSKVGSSPGYYWNESVQALIDMWSKMFNNKTEYILESNNGVFSLGKTDTSVTMPKNSSSDNDVQISALLRADAGNYFGREQKTSEAITQGYNEIKAPKGYHFLTEPWVQPYFNKNGRSYKGVRDNDLELNAISSPSNLSFTEEKRNNGTYVRLLMPKNQRKIEVEDLNRNFWVIGTTVSILSSLIFPLGGGAQQGILKAISEEVYQLWENVKFLWGYAKAKTAHDSYTHCEVLDLQQSFSPCRKYDNFEAFLKDFEDSLPSQNISTNYSIDRTSFWNDSAYAAFKEFCQPQLDAMKGKYSESNLAILIRLRYNNYEKNYFSTVIYPCMFFYHREFDQWLMGRFYENSESSPKPIILKAESLSNCYGITIEKGRKLYTKNYNNPTQYLDEVTLYKLLEEQVFLNFNVSSYIDNEQKYPKVTLVNPPSATNGIKYVDIVPEILGFKKIPRRTYKFLNITDFSETGYLKINYNYHDENYSGNNEGQINIASVWQGCSVGDLLSCKKTVAALPRGTIFNMVNMIPFLNDQPHEYPVGGKIETYTGSQLDFTKIKSISSSVLEKWGNETGLVCKGLISNTFSKGNNTPKIDGLNKYDTFIGVGNHLIFPTEDINGNLKDFYYYDGYRVQSYKDNNGVKMFEAAAAPTALSYPQTTAFVNTNGASTGLYIYLGSCGVEICLPKIFFATNYFDYGRVVSNPNNYNNFSTESGTGLFNYKITVYSENGDLTIENKWLLKLQIVAGFGYYYDVSDDWKSFKEKEACNTFEELISSSYIDFSDSITFGANTTFGGLTTGIATIYAWGQKNEVKGYTEVFYQRPTFTQELYSNQSYTVTRKLILPWTQDALVYSVKSREDTMPDYSNWTEIKVPNNQSGPFFTNNDVAKILGVQNIDFELFPDNGCTGNVISGG